MKKPVCITLVAILFCVPLLQAGCAEIQHGTRPDGHDSGPPSAVNESARDIPVAYDVDVVVVGGTSGGVAAAVEAAKKGARVSLAAERPYLGEDLCGTYRLWLEPGEEPISPLAKKLFAEPAAAQRMRNAISFSYTADRPSAGVHKDTQPPSLLADGKWHSAASQSVQYDGDVTVTAELDGEHTIEKAHVMVYQRDNNFAVAGATVYISDDKQQWKQVAVTENQKLGQGSFEESAIDLSAQVSERARYLKFVVKKSPNVTRVLLGEILMEAEQQTAKPTQSYRFAPTPMQVKRTLDQALLDAHVEFLFGCYATDVLYDADGKLAGIVMANRSGRQAVKAKVIIDATPRASVARMAGAVSHAYPAGNQTFKRVVVGGDVRQGEGIRARKMPTPLWTGQGRSYPATEYTLTISIGDGSFASFAQAEQIARDKTWHPQQGDDSEILFQVPPDPMKGKTSLSGVWPGAEKVSLDVFRPAGVSRLYVLGGCADMSRDAAEKLLRPLEFMQAGARIGAAAASEAKALRRLRGVRLRGEPAEAVAAGDVLENLAWLRPAQTELGCISANTRAVPVLGEYDVIVVGGGTGGAPAGISAARQGAKTLVIEYLHGLGGVGTLGLISKYYHGYIKGFTQEVDEGVASLAEDGKSKNSGWNIEWKMEWYRRELRKAGADIWFGVLGCGAFVDKGRIKGVIVATPQGRGVVLAKVVIDSTGNADIAAVAGATCVYTDGSNVAVQGAGLPPRKMGAGYTNTDWTFIDDADVIDIWRAFVIAKEKYEGAYDLGQLVDTRERRRIVGDFVMSPLDISNNRTYPDTVVIASSDFDSHGFTIHPVFLLKPPDRSERIANVPYRCLLPKGLEGILVTGLGVSAHRDAIPVIRMQADIQNQGYAAGVAAAMAAQSSKSVREIDIRALQRHLIEKGNLPERVLTDKEAYPLSKETIAQAVKSVADDFKGLEVVLAQPEDALPILREAYAASDSEKAKLAYAHILGMLGDATGVEALLEAVKSRDWDKGWNFTGMGQYGASLSPLDSLIVALGRTGDKRAVNVIVGKIGQLDAKSEFSHFRAVAMALEALGDPAAAEPLAQLLKKPDMADYAFTKIEEARQRTPASPTDTSTRNLSLRELFLARALYRCGDYKGLGEKILKEYTRDLRGHYARHASAVLRKETPH
jgi:flavin-dependent dehydrogenase